MNDILILGVIVVIIVILIFLMIPIIILRKINNINQKFESLDDKLTIINYKLEALNKAPKEETVNRETLPVEDNIPFKNDNIPISVADETIRYMQEPLQETEPIKDTDSRPKEKILPPPFDRESIDQPKETQRLYHVYYNESDGYSKNSFISQLKDAFRKIFGDNILTKIGVITLVLGIGFFVKYAIDQDWINEIGRVGIGMFTGALIIGIAHRCRKNFHIFSSILVGGGIAVFYITITLAFREYELFTQTVAFILLIIVTCFSVVLSLLYDRKELAIFSLLGAYASPLMVSTGAGNYIVLFTYLLIVNVGMLCVSFVKKWRIIGVIAYIMNLCFFWGWLFNSFEEQYFGAMLFASLFFLQFYLLAIIDHHKYKNKITSFQIILILTDNLSLFLAYVYITGYNWSELRGVLTIAIALVNVIILFFLYRKSNIDRNLLYLIIGVALTFVSLSIPMQLDGYSITMFWAVEMVVLLWIWQRSKIEVFRLGFLAIILLVLISYMIDISKSYNSSFEIANFINSLFITGCVVIIAFVISSFLLRREEGIIRIGNFNLISVSILRSIFYVISVLLIFIVPYQEISFQVDKYFEYNNSSDFHALVMCTYAFLFIAILACVRWYKGKVSKMYFGFFLASVIFYILVYIPICLNFRESAFFEDAYPHGYFSVHFIGLLSIALLIVWLCRSMRTVFLDRFTLISWILVILSVVILSIETDNIVILLFGNSDNYYPLLYDLHTFGYPILWGLMAFALMVWGIKCRIVVLRKISLIFFALIIVKFYIYDVWHMSQTGRIVSFVALGIILLLVSFMQQKIKTLVKGDVSDINENAEKSKDKL